MGEWESKIRNSNHPNVSKKKKFLLLNLLKNIKLLLRYFVSRHLYHYYSAHTKRDSEFSYRISVVHILKILLSIAWLSLLQALFLSDIHEMIETESQTLVVRNSTPISSAQQSLEWNSFKSLPSVTLISKSTLKISSAVCRYLFGASK